MIDYDLLKNTFQKFKTDLVAGRGLSGETSYNKYKGDYSLSNKPVKGVHGCFKIEFDDLNALSQLISEELNEQPENVKKYLLERAEQDKVNLSSDLFFLLRLWLIGISS